ncbi:hypothetical protein VTJ49DRAFT_1036 [Mycothermus thermophilus]|uniref:Uncharacterized protein n=1 Tax=Humicola insolens TaxID=85995 RepID=A0ABR3VDR1_HUMIN
MQELEGRIKDGFKKAIDEVVKRLDGLEKEKDKLAKENAKLKAEIGQLTENNNNLTYIVQTWLKGKKHRAASEASDCNYRSIASQAVPPWGPCNKFINFIDLWLLHPDPPKAAQVQNTDSDSDSEFDSDGHSSYSSYDDDDDTDCRIRPSPSFNFNRGYVQLPVEHDVLDFNERMFPGTVMAPSLSHQPPLFLFASLSTANARYLVEHLLTTGTTWCRIWDEALYKWILAEQHSREKSWYWAIMEELMARIRGAALAGLSAV